MEPDRREHDAAVRAFEGLSEAALRELVVDKLRLLADNGLQLIAASEGTVWLEQPQRRVLVPVYNSGDHGEYFYQHEQSIDRGMLGMVFQTETPIAEGEVYRNRSQDPSLDQKLGLLTCSMVAVPLVLFGRTRGVISAIRSKAAGSTAPDPAPFPADALASLQRLAREWGELFGERWLAVWSRGDH